MKGIPHFLDHSLPQRDSALRSHHPVVTDVSANAYLIEEGANRFLVPVDGIEAAANALTRYLRRLPGGQGPDLRQTRGIGDWHSVVSQVLEFMIERTQHRNGAVL